MIWLLRTRLSITMLSSITQTNHGSLNVKFSEQHFKATSVGVCPAEVAAAPHTHRHTLSAVSAADAAGHHVTFLTRQQRPEFSIKHVVVLILTAAHSSRLFILSWLNARGGQHYRAGAGSWSCPGFCLRIYCELGPAADRGERKWQMIGSRMEALGCWCRRGLLPAGHTLHFDLWRCLCCTDQVAVVLEFSAHGSVRLAWLEVMVLRTERNAENQLKKLFPQEEKINETNEQKCFRKSNVRRICPSSWYLIVRATDERAAEMTVCLQIVKNVNNQSQNNIKHIKYCYYFVIN